MTSTARTHTFPNGLTLLAEPMRGVASAAMTLLLPAGAARDPAGRVGSATVLGDLVFRGAGEHDSRALVDDLDALGLQRSSGAGLYHLRFYASGLAANVLGGLPLYADVVRRPRLLDAEFEPARELAVAGVESLDDDPRGRTSYLLRAQHWPAPFDRNPMGTLHDLEALTGDELRAHYARVGTPSNAILAVAGDVDFEQWRDRVEALFGDWRGEPSEDPPAGDVRGPRHHEHADSEQTHIGLAFDAADERAPDYYAGRIFGEAMSGGMSGRLFAEIREKRGLCYSVGIGYASLVGRASYLGYAGTTNERAQQTLDAFLGELARVREGVDEDEVERGKIGLKSSVVLSGESSGARAGALAGDWHTFGRVRPMSEVLAELDKIDACAVNRYLADRPPGDFTVVTVGPNELEVSA